jgi:hypothetical protein
LLLPIKNLGVDFDKYTTSNTYLLGRRCKIGLEKEFSNKILMVQFGLTTDEGLDRKIICVQMELQFT